MATNDEAGQYNFTIYHGQPFRRAFCRKVDAVATDWTDYTGLCQIRTKAGATDVTTTATITFDADTTTGNFYLDLTAEQVALFTVGFLYSYDVRMTKTGVAPLYPIKGTINVATRVSLPA
jgi:hypothetical protein